MSFFFFKYKVETGKKKSERPYSSLDNHGKCVNEYVSL